MTGGVRPILSLARASSPGTGGDAARGTPPRLEPLLEGTTPSRPPGLPEAAATTHSETGGPERFLAAAGHPGRQASQPISARGWAWLPGNGAYS